MENLRVEAKTRNADQLLRKLPHLSDLGVTCLNLSEIAVIVGADQPVALEIMEYQRDPLVQLVDCSLISGGRSVAHPHLSEGSDSLVTPFRSMNSTLNLRTF